MVEDRLSRSYDEDAVSTSEQAEATEETLLLPHDSSAESSSNSPPASLLVPSKLQDEEDLAGSLQPTPAFATIISVLLIGVFFANADTALVLANYGAIASEFGELHNASWVITSYMLGLCATQGMYGKFSDIFGRKAVLIFSYAVFGVGCLIMFVLFYRLRYHGVIVGRVIAGVGGAGMTSVVSMIVTDLVPMRQVATWRSYIYAAAVVGRASGAPLGGVLADTIGWRWAFMGQAPVALLSIILVLMVLQLPDTSTLPLQEIFQDERAFSSLRRKFQRVDFLGALLLALSITSLLVFLDLGGQKYAWSNRKTLSFMASWVVSSVLFCVVEGFWAIEPIFPLKLLAKRDVFTTYLVEALGTGAQLGMITVVAIYFRVTQNASNTVAALHILPNNVAHALGGLLAGYLITKYAITRNNYPKRGSGAKDMLTCITIVGYAMIILRWRGHTNLLESLYVVPGGFGMGIANAATFIALTAGLEKEDTAIAISGSYLCDSLGFVLGVSGSSAVNDGVLKSRLSTRLNGIDKQQEYIKSILSSIDNLNKLPEAIREVAVDCYIEAIKFSNVFALSCSIATVVLVVVFMREYRLQEI